MHFHVGQFQTIEYQAMARDRDWFEIALTEIAPWLAETQGLESEAWEAWQQAEALSPQANGSCGVTGRVKATSSPT